MQLSLEHSATSSHSMLDLFFSQPCAISCWSTYPTLLFVLAICKVILPDGTTFAVCLYPYLGMPQLGLDSITLIYMIYGAGQKEAK